MHYIKTMLNSLHNSKWRCFPIHSFQMNSNHKQVSFCLPTHSIQLKSKCHFSPVSLFLFFVFVRTQTNELTYEYIKTMLNTLQKRKCRCFPTHAFQMNRNHYFENIVHFIETQFKVSRFSAFLVYSSGVLVVFRALPFAFGLNGWHASSNKPSSAFALNHNGENRLKQI